MILEGTIRSILFDENWCVGFSSGVSEGLTPVLTGVSDCLTPVLTTAHAALENEQRETKET